MRTTSFLSRRGPRSRPRACSSDNAVPPARAGRLARLRRCRRPLRRWRRRPHAARARWRAGLRARAHLAGLRRARAAARRRCRTSVPGRADARGRDGVREGARHAPRCVRSSAPSRVSRVLAHRQRADGRVDDVGRAERATGWASPRPDKPVVIRGIALLLTKDDGTHHRRARLFDVAVGEGAARRRAQGAPRPAAAPAGHRALPRSFEQTRTPEEARNVAIGAAGSTRSRATDEAAYLGATTDDVDGRDAPSARSRCTARTT